VSTPCNATDRLREIERILSHPKTPAPGDHADAVAVHLAEVASTRIRELTSTLQRRSDEAVDAIDGLTMRLLLNDFVVAVGHFRAVARDAAARIDGAVVPIKSMQRIMKWSDARHDETVDANDA
jgi:hypothetical protein